VSDRTLLLVFSNAVSGHEDEFDAWYEGQHLSDVLAVPGVSAAQRFALVETPTAQTPPHRRLAVYELDGEPGAVLAEFGSRFASGVMELSPSLDVAGISMHVWRAAGTRHTAD
jgi:hypothetical protein